MSKMHSRFRQAPVALVAALAAVASSTPSVASDHLDSPSVIADPRADIGDLYAWMAPDGRHLNVVMTIVGHTFSDKIAYVFHIDSGSKFGRSTSTVNLTCRFASATSATCALGNEDRLDGDASSTAGLMSKRGTFRLFAGLRDDPFFNNVRGTRAMYDVATKALAGTAHYDAAGCPQFDSVQSEAIRDAWRHTGGGPATNFLRGWTPDSIVASIDLGSITKGGPLVAVWAATVGPKGQIDRAARPLTGNALLVTLGSDDAQNDIKERYNHATPATGGQFRREIAKGVALYDGLDGRCGDSMLINKNAPPARRYEAMADVLADDRLWVNTRSTVCTQLFAVERAALNREPTLASDCGGRTVNYDAVNVYRSLIANGTAAGIDDGVHADEKTHSTSLFPFPRRPRSGATRMRISRILLVGATAVLAFIADPAAAHTGTGLAGGFASGFEHPLSGWDHLLAMVSVGLWGAFLGRPLLYLLPVTFPLMMVMGAVAGMFALTAPPVEVGIALSVAALGLCIAGAWRAPVWMAVAIVAIFALFHGYAHGRELPSAADPIGYSTGFVLATGMLHVVGIAFGLVASDRRGRAVVRVAGGAIAAAGTLFLVQAIST